MNNLLESILRLEILSIWVSQIDRLLRLMIIDKFQSKELSMVGNKQIAVNEKGSALVTVILVLVVVTISVASMVALFNNNLNQIVYQEDSMRAYYIARSGIELAYSALMTEGEDLLNTFKTGGTNAAQTLQIDGGTMPLGEGNVAVSIARCVNPTGASDIWVQIESVGTLSDPAISSRMRLRFNVDNPEQRILDKL